MSETTKAIIAKLAVQWKQPTTLAGLTAVLGMFGLVLTPEWSDIIYQAGGIIIAVILIFVSEKPAENKEEPK